MPTVRYNASHFPPAYHPLLAGHHSLDFTWAELVWSAVSVGRRELLHLFRHGPFSAFEMVYRAAMVYANLRQTAANTIVRSSAYDGLDPSEKSAISYFMGMTMAKLFADKLLNTPWLMHLDVYRAQLGPAFVAGGSKPDLVGQDSAGQWIAIESKGRTNEFDSVPLTRAKQQVSNLATIGGVAPVLRVAFLAYFDEGVLTCALDDPKGKKEEPETIDIPLSKEELFRGYYRPFREWLQEAPDTHVEEIEDRRYTVGYMREVDVSVGVREEILQAAAPRARREQALREDQYEGPDGLMVRVGPLWSEANMQREPQERN